MGPRLGGTNKTEERAGKEIILQKWAPLRTERHIFGRNIETYTKIRRRVAQKSIRTKCVPSDSAATCFSPKVIEARQTTRRTKNTKQELKDNGKMSRKEIQDVDRNIERTD